MNTILIADDNSSVRHILSRALDAPGRRVLVAKDGLVALALARQQSPDLIVLDVLMPGRDGRQVCRDLREDPATSRIPVLMLSDLNETGHARDGKSSGADDYIGKPFAPDEVAARVTALLARGPRPEKQLGIAARLRAALSAR